jgi:hypothetical protein
MLRWRGRRIVVRQLDDDDDVDGGDDDDNNSNSNSNYCLAREKPEFIGFYLSTHPTHTFHHM